VVSSISGFTGSVSEARTLAAEVDNASRQQQQGLEAVAGNVAQLERVTQATAAAAEESAAASEQLHAHSELSLGAVADLATVVGDRAKPVVAPRRARPAGPALQLEPARRVTSRAA
jgi:methyl-accepting chemotaxis protein